MELTCSRCHQTVQSADCFCPFCGLPQLVYSSDGAAGSGQPERWGEPVRDASQVDWKPALRSALALAIPAGLFCSYPVTWQHLWPSVDGRNWSMGGCTLYAQPTTGVDYHRRGCAHRPSDRGSRQLDLRRYYRLHSLCDAFLAAPGKCLRRLLAKRQPAVPQWTTMGVDAQSMAILKAMMTSPEGRAGWVLGAMAMLMAALLLFATAGGALSAHFLARHRRPQS